MRYISIYINIYELKNFNLQDASGGKLTHFVKDGFTVRVYLREKKDITYIQLKIHTKHKGH